MFDKVDGLLPRDRTRSGCPQQRDSATKNSSTRSMDRIGKLRADLEVSRTIEDVRDAEHARFLNWWSLDDGNRFGLEAELPAAQGAVVVRALERMSDSIPLMPGEDDPAFAAARRADALVALCSNRIAVDADPDRSTV